MNLVPDAVMLARLIYALPRSKAQPGLLRHGDWIGISPMAIGLATFRTVLDDSNVDDWVGSPCIVKLSILYVIALVTLVIFELRHKTLLVRLRRLRQRNFGFATLSNFLLGFARYSQTGK